jgi:uncharacterized protein (TIGR02596 family)
MPRLRMRRGQAFTLVELLAVMAVMGIMLVLVAPAMNQILRGSNMTQSGQFVSDQLTLARQTAMTTGRTVQVRFYLLPVSSPGSATNYAAVQCFRMEENGTPTALTKMQSLLNRIIFASDATHSTILANTAPTVTGSSTLPAYGNQICPYVGFQYLRDGSTDLDPSQVATNGGWFVTLVDANKPIPAGGLPTNYYSVRVEPLTGHIRAFRP